VWNKRFRAFGMMRKWAPALSSDGAASSQKLVGMYSTLILALPENDLSIIENVSEDDKTCGHTSRTA
jgi:CubicO group peptidase (beta-lactamase class C family)